MENTVEMKVAEFAKTNRVNKTKLFALVEEVIAMSGARSNKRVEKMETRNTEIMEMIAKMGRVTVRELEATGVKNARYTIARLQDSGLVKRAEEGVKLVTKGRSNIAYEVV